MNHPVMEKEINQQLQNDDQLASYGLKARVDEAGNVEVQGIVDVLAEKYQVEELVRGVPGVKSVENDITVCTDGAIDDEDVAFEVSEELRANPEVPDSVGVKVDGGQVQLVGSANDSDETKAAVETAAKARGVREVYSQVKLKNRLT